MAFPMERQINEDTAQSTPDHDVEAFLLTEARKVGGKVWDDGQEEDHLGPMNWPLRDLCVERLS